MKGELINFVECIEQLPVLPATTVRLIQLLNDKDTRIDQILEVIQYDQNLTLEILKLCNSAYFGLVRQVHSLRDAVVYLGAKHLMQMVLGIHCNSMLQQPKPGYGLLTGMLWRHSTAVALAADKFLVEKNHNKPSSGLLFTAGLLHDIGKVILDQLLASRYVQILEFVNQRPISFHEAEREILGYNHCDVGEMIMLHWQLPEVMASVCRYHHNPSDYRGEDPQSRQCIDLVHIADSLVLSLGLGIGNDGLQYPFDSALAEQYCLKADKIDKIGTEVLNEITMLEQQFQKTQGS